MVGSHHYSLVGIVVHMEKADNFRGDMDSRELVLRKI